MFLDHDLEDEPQSGTRKISDLPPNETCMHPEHNPPTHMVYTDGIWRHVCPGCGYTQTFTVRNPRM
jgi:hypothetical protein